MIVTAYVSAGAMSLTPSPGTAGTESTKAKDLIDQRLRTETPAEEYVVVESPAATADRSDRTHRSSTRS